MRSATFGFLASSRVVWSDRVPHYGVPAAYTSALILPRLACFVHRVAPDSGLRTPGLLAAAYRLGSIHFQHRA